MFDILKFDYWVLFGFFAQFLFFLRFIVQWLYSEKHKKSVVPIYFWYFSVLGAMAIMVYAWHIQDPVFFVGQGAALLIYTRNIFLIRRSKQDAVV